MARRPFKIPEEFAAPEGEVELREPEKTLLPTAAVAIVGRPNVGKSTLFNALLGRRIAITDKTPGTTRDRILHPLEREGKVFDLVDTGGIGIVDEPVLADRIERQIAAAMEEADVLVLLLDAAEGLVPLDREVAERVRRLGKPFVLAANKVDNAQREAAVSEFAELGMGEPLAVSALHRSGLEDLLDAVAELVPPPEERPAEEAEVPKIAVLGRRAVGKSTFVNCLAGDERVIVGESPGTTRDAVDVRFERDGKKFIAIDTAGFRKARATRTVIELSALFRAERALRRADVAVLMLDAVEGAGFLDKRLAGAVFAESKPCVIAVNKWDLAEARGVEPEEYARYVRESLPSLTFAPIIFLAAKEGRQVWETVELALELRRQAATRLPTAAINRVLAAAGKANSPHRPHSPRKRKGARGEPRRYFAAQIASSPPTILVFVNNPALFQESYVRYLQERFRRGLEAEEIPVRVLLRARKRVKKERQRRGPQEKKPGAKRPQKKKERKRRGPQQERPGAKRAQKKKARQRRGPQEKKPEAQRARKKKER